MMIINWQGLPQESRQRPRRPLRRLLQGAHRRAVGPLAQRRRFVVAPGCAALRRVRSQGVDHPFTMELAAFGTSGAVSEF